MVNYLLMTCALHKVLVAYGCLAEQLTYHMLSVKRLLEATVMYKGNYNFIAG